MRPRAAAGTLVLALAACATPAPPVGPGGCNAAGAAAFVGKVADEATLAALYRSTGTQTSRIVRPGMMVTMDYRDGRITVDVDAANRIVRAACG